MTLVSFGFEKHPIGLNCPAHRVVATLDECISASAVLGLVFGYLLFNQASRPAGCYWESGTSWFNAVVDPSLTSPGSFSDRGGVCVKGKFGLVVEGQIFT